MKNYTVKMGDLTQAKKAFIFEVEIPGDIIPEGGMRHNVSGWISCNCCLHVGNKVPTYATRYIQRVFSQNLEAIKEEVSGLASTWVAPEFTHSDRAKEVEKEYRSIYSFNSDSKVYDWEKQKKSKQTLNDIYSIRPNAKADYLENIERNNYIVRTFTYLEECQLFSIDKPQSVSQFETTSLEEAKAMYQREVDYLEKHYTRDNLLDYSPTDREYNDAIFCEILLPVLDSDGDVTDIESVELSRGYFEK